MNFEKCQLELTRKDSYAINQFINENIMKAIYKKKYIKK